MIQKTISILTLLGLVWAPSFALAKPNPPGLEVASNVYSLGQAFDAKSQTMVEGFAIVHKKSPAKGGGAVKGPKAPKCYGVMAAGAKWKSVEPWEVFAGGDLSGSFLLNTLNTSIGTWESAASANILGTGSLGSGSITDPYTLDDENQVSFGDLDAGTIAVTVVWGVFSGPTFNRSLVAWDQVYNTDFAWTDDAAVETDQMDFWNIAIHELGHAMGLADIYTSSCSQVTMYGYGEEGETNKRTLDPADITGINTLY